MSAFPVHMRRVIGEEAANATLARNVVLPAVADELPSGGGGEPDLHRRCVLFDCAPSRVRVDEVCAALAPSGGGADIEAVALCWYFVAAVVVFRTAAGAESALRGPARRSCHAVPPLDLGVKIPFFIGPTDVKFMSDSPIQESCTPPPPPPPPPEPEPKPWIEFRDPSAEAGCGGRQFSPSCESLVHGPTRGADGSLWMYGNITSADRRGIQIGASMRVRRADPPPKDKRRPGIPDERFYCAWEH